MTPENHAAMLDSVTGRQSRQPCPAAIGQKFTATGDVLPFAGNTFICHINPTSDEFRVLGQAQAMLRDGAPVGAYTYLPLASLHMTVFEGVCDAFRTPDKWPRNLEPTLPVDAVTLAFLPRLAGLPLPGRFTIAPVELYCGIALNVAGATPQDTADLWFARNLLREATGIQTDSFATYQFHISLAYLCRFLTEGEALAMQDLSNQVLAMLQRDAATITLGPIEFCRFNDMHGFVPVKP